MRELKELKTLLELSKNHFTKLTFEASVTTGLEQTALDELFEKFGKNIKACFSRGRVFFNTKFDKYQSYKLLRSVDRVNVLAGFTTVSLTNDLQLKSKDLDEIKNTVKVFDWEKVIAIWQEIEGFDGNLYPTRKQYERASSNNFSTKDQASEKSDSENDEVEFKCEKVFFEKTQLEKALDSVLTLSDDENNITVNNNDNKIPRFRVTCNRVGEKHTFSSQEAATAFGGLLQDKFNWIVDLSHYDIEIILEVNNEDVYAGIALNKKSNHFRNITFFSLTTLRATICYNLLRLCNVKPGDIVVDPMCGCGAIPIEGTLSFPNAYFLGGDIHDKAAVKTRCNINALEKNLKIDNLKWDSTRLPLRTNSIDVFVSDFPFGKRCGTKANNKALFKNALNDLARVLKKKSGRCVILTADKTSFNVAYQLTKTFWKLRKNFIINIGGIRSSCFVLERTEEEFQLKLSRKEKRALAFQQWLKEKGFNKRND